MANNFAERMLPKCFKHFVIGFSAHQLQVALIEVASKLFVSFTTDFKNFPILSKYSLIAMQADERALQRLLQVSMTRHATALSAISNQLTFAQPAR